MNDIIKSESLTMSSRDIAALVESRHSNVCVAIERLMRSKIIGEYAAMQYTHPQNGQSYNEYHIGKRDSYVVVAQLSPQFTARLVDRWQELEEQASYAPAIPQTYAEALQLAADQAKQLELQAPKVAFVENLVERNTLMTATQVAQKHGLSAIKLNRILDELGGVYSKNVKRSRVFCQSWIDKGYGQMKQTETGHDQALFTPAGEVRIHELMISEGVL